MKRIQIVAATLAALAVLSGGAFYLRSSSAGPKPAAVQAPAMPVPVAVIEQHEVTTWDELELLDAQRSELRNRREALQVRSARYQSTVALVRALGGSWE